VTLDFDGDRERVAYSLLTFAQDRPKAVTYYNASTFGPGLPEIAYVGYIPERHEVRSIDLLAEHVRCHQCEADYRLEPERE
jgi:hypothetical protein